MSVISNSAQTRAARRLATDFLKCSLKDVNTFCVEPGDAAPILSGKRTSSHHETRGGSRIYHPNAYAKKGRSNMVYCSAEFYAVEVGMDWLAQTAKTRAERRSILAILGDIGRQSPEARQKRQQRAANKLVAGPHLLQRLFAWKLEKFAWEEEVKFVERRLEFHTAGFDLDRIKSGTYVVFAPPACPNDRYDPDKPSTKYYGWWEQFLCLPAVAKVMEAYQAELDHYAAVLADQTKRYNEATLLPVGRIRFTNEGCFSVN